MDIFQRPWLSNGPNKSKPSTMAVNPSGETSPRSTNSSSHSHEYEYRDRLRTWLVKMIESADIPGLTWLNEEKNVFRMPWKHAGRQDYNLEDSKIFMEWAKHSGRYREGVDKPEPIVWKTRLRCALNKMPDIRELPDMSRLDISDPYRVYELLPPMHKGKGADEKIRRRIYKRSLPASGTPDEAIDPPKKPFVERTRGSTGSQSGSHDSNDDLSDPDQTNQDQWFKPMTHPIPVQPAAHANPSTHSGMTPSTLALSLLNCNPLVAQDPVLSTSLTSLATQILHMEHLIQMYMSQVRAEQAEKSKLAEQMTELRRTLQLAKTERLTLQQTLVAKLIHETPGDLEQHIHGLESNLAVLRAVSKVKHCSLPPLHHNEVMRQLPVEIQLSIMREQLDKARDSTNRQQSNQSNAEKPKHFEKHQPLTIGTAMQSPPSSRTSDLEEEIEVIE